MPSGIRRFFLLVIIIGLVAAIAIVVIQFVGGSDEERYHAALLALLYGRSDRAAVELDRMSSKPEFRDHRQLLQGGLLLRTGRPAEAEKWLAVVDREGDLRREALLLLGECYYRQQRLAKAESCFLDMADDDPDDVDAHRWLGSVYYDLGRVTDAIDQLQHVIRLVPSDFRSYRFLGIIYQDLGRYTQAGDAYQEALGRNPPDDIKKEMQLDLARLLVRHKEYVRAIAVLDRAPGLAGDPVALAIRAECASALGEKTKAKRLIEQVLKALPADRDTLLLNARIAKDDLGWDEAIRSLVKLLKTDPHDFEARYMLARTYAMKGDRENSQRELKLSEDSKSIKARASNLTERAMREPTNAAVREELAGVCDELGEFKLAARWRQAALALLRPDGTATGAAPPGMISPNNVP